MASNCNEHVCVCVSVCLSVHEDISGTTRAVFTNFSVHVAYGRASVLLRQGWRNPKRNGQFWGFPPLTMICNAFAAKGIIQLPITSFGRRDHSLCQASANKNPENSERMRCGLSVGKRWWECRARAKYDIYDCLVVNDFRLTVKCLKICLKEQNCW